jgi:hypothetical protein
LTKVERIEKYKAARRAPKGPAKRLLDVRDLDTYIEANKTRFAY